MKAIKTTILFCLAVLFVVSSPAPADAADMAMLVVPARIRVLQIAFDLAGRRPLKLVSYQGAPDSAMAFHVWAGSDWVRISRDTLKEMCVSDPQLRHVVLIGDISMVSEPLIDAVSGHKGFVRIPSVDAAEIINTLKEPLRLTTSDLLWLAERYELDFVDLNEAKRRQMREAPLRPRVSKPQAEAAPLPAPEKLAPVPVEVKQF